MEFHHSRVSCGIKRRIAQRMPLGTAMLLIDFNSCSYSGYCLVNFMRFQVLRVVLALLLIGASLCKFATGLGGAFSPIGGGLFVGPIVMSTAVLAEFLVGGFLLTLGNRVPLIAWKIAVSVFTLFGVVSLLSLLKGSPCACFGYVTDSALPALIVDTISLFALLATRPRSDSNGLLSLSKNWPAMLGAVCAILLLYSFSFSSPVRAYYYRMLGFVIVPDAFSRIVAIPESDAGEVTFSWTNVSDKRVSILGANTTCGCMTPLALPVELGPGDTSDVVFKVVKKSRDASGWQIERARFYFDLHTAPVVLTLWIRH
jgi:hypothetical protein